MLKVQAHLKKMYEINAYIQQEILCFNNLLEKIKRLTNAENQDWATVI